MSGVPSLSIFSPGIGVYPSAWANGVTQGGALYSDLRQFSGMTNMCVFMVGTAAAVDGGQGLFVWNSSVTATDDGGVTVIVPFGTSQGAWLRCDPIPPTPTGNASIPTAASFGVIGDGTTDDTAAWNTAFSTLPAGSPLLAIGKTGNTFKITAPLSINVNGLVLSGGSGATGGGAKLCSFVASGNFSAVFTIGASAANVLLEDLSVVTTGTSTPCVNLAVGSQAINFDRVAFTGNLSGNLVYSQCAGFLTCRDCVWQCDSAGTLGLTLDGYNQNTLVSGGRAGGVGGFFTIVNSTGNPANGVQGVILESVHTVCTGPFTVSIAGNAYQVTIDSCTFDQAATNCVVIGQASLVTITGGWIGLQSGSMGQALLVLSSALIGITIANNTFFGGSANIYVQSSAGARVGQIIITGNTFQAASGSALTMDAINSCIIEDNTDLGPSPQGSWGTIATNTSGGAYIFGSNSWVPVAVANAHAASSYFASGYDRGPGAMLKASGLISSPSGSSITFPHGLVLTPDIVNVTPNGGGGLSFTAAASGANITIGYSVPGAANFFWTAEVHR